ncbi:MAG: hypothetical protein AAFO69_20200, partial [Bacteroidota bacterium]
MKLFFGLIVRRFGQAFASLLLLLILIPWLIEWFTTDDLFQDSFSLRFDIFFFGSLLWGIVYTIIDYRFQSRWLNWLFGQLEDTNYTIDQRKGHVTLFCDVNGKRVKVKFEKRGTFLFQKTGLE